MNRILLSEFERTFKRKKTIVALLIYLFVILLQCFFLYLMGGISFYEADHAVELNSINTSPFFIRELGLIITYILIPMFVIDSFNGEYHSGALRLVLIRPQKRMKLFLAKWLVLSSIILALTFITWLIAVIFGQITMPHVNQTTFWNTESMNLYEGMVYTLKFYGITYIIFSCVIGICCLMSIIMPNPILAYIGSLAFLIGSIYISDQFIYFITISDAIFNVLGNVGQSRFFISLLSLFVICHIMCIGVWNRKQWIG